MEENEDLISNKSIPTGNTTFLHLHADIPFVDDEDDDTDDVIVKSTNQENCNKSNTSPAKTTNSSPCNKNIVLPKLRSISDYKRNNSNQSNKSEENSSLIGQNNIQSETVDGQNSNESSPAIGQNSNPRSPVIGRNSNQSSPIIDRKNSNQSDVTDNMIGGESHMTSTTRANEIEDNKQNNVKAVTMETVQVHNSNNQCLHNSLKFGTVPNRTAPNNSVVNSSFRQRHGIRTNVTLDLHENCSMGDGNALSKFSATQNLYPNERFEGEEIFV